MIKKIVISIFLISLAFLIPSSWFNAYSQTQDVEEIKSDLIYPYPPPDYTGFLGEDHKYSVHLRGNGEAVVTAKFTFVNKSQEDQTTYELTTDGEELTDIIAYQVYSGPKPWQVYQVVEGIEAWRRRYSQVDVTYDGKKLTIALPQAIVPDQQGGVFLYFRTFDFVDKELLGGHEYEFESFSTINLIDKMTVGINVDSDIYLKEAKGQVDYSAPEAARLSMDSSAIQGEQLDQIVNSIGYGQITKTASNLNKGETFEIEGEYASSQILLYSKEIAVALLVLLLIFVVIALLAKRLKGKKNSVALLTSLVSAFCSTLGIGVVTVLFYIFFQIISQHFIYGVSGLSIVVGIIAFLVYATLFFAPSVFVGIKYGVGWGLATLIATIVMLAFLTFMVVVLFGVKQFAVPPIYYPLNRLDIEKSIEVPSLNQ